MLILLFVVSGAIFLMSTNDLVSIFLSIELQSYGCAPGEAYTAEVTTLIILRLVLSDIFGLSYIERYLPRVITLSAANNILDRVADYKKICREGLPLLEVYFSGGGHGQDNEFDTQRGAQLGLYVLSRILRHIKGTLNVIIGSPYDDNCQKPFTHFSIEDRNAQSPKTTNLNASVLQPRDLTAYVFNMNITRRRSFHSRNTVLKESSRKTPLNDAHDSNNNKDADELNLLGGSKSNTSISS
jgi:hypothetical protein